MALRSEGPLSTLFAPIPVAPAKDRKGACVTNAPSEYDGGELYER